MDIWEIILLVLSGVLLISLPVIWLGVIMLPYKLYRTRLEFDANCKEGEVEVIGYELYSVAPLVKLCGGEDDIPTRIGMMRGVKRSTHPVGTRINVKYSKISAFKPYYKVVCSDKYTPLEKNKVIGTCLVITGVLLAVVNWLTPLYLLGWIIGMLRKS